MVYSTRRFVVCLSMCHFVLVFFSPFSIAITSLGEERADLSAFRTFVRFVLVWMSVSSSSWGLGRAAVCDCGTPWTFLLPYFGRLVFDSTKHWAHDLINITTDLRPVIITQQFATGAIDFLKVYIFFLVSVLFTYDYHNKNIAWKPGVLILKWLPPSWIM